jgi:OOP family OmpA-OmpF porin
MGKIFSKCSIMKKMAPVLMASVLLLPLTARAEIKAGSVEVTPYAGYNFFEKRQNLENQPIVGGRLGYNITNWLGIEGNWNFIKSYVDDKSTRPTMQGQFSSPTDSVFITHYNLDLLYHFFPESRINPYITAGYGIVHYTPKINNKNLSVLDFGVGAKFWVADNIALRADIRDNMIFDEHIHDVATTLGVVFAFGGKSAAPAPVEPPPAPAPVPVPKAVEPPPAPPATPTAALSIDPATVTKGQSAIITWKSQNASGCEIQPAIGSVPPEGVRTITPVSSTTYNLACSGAGGSATSTVLVTVVLPPPPVPAPLPPKAAAAAKRFCSKPAVLAINFDTDKSDIKPEYHDELKTVGDFLMYFPNAKGEISGHTDSVGSNAYNEKLSDRRAESVGSYIRTTFGVKPGRITTKGYGETKPVASNKTKAGKAKNRRIEANFTCD